LPFLRRRTSHGLPAVLGTGDLFADGVRQRRLVDLLRARRHAIYALGLTPSRFAISGLIFAFTAATTPRPRRASPRRRLASFARHAFNELVSFSPPGPRC
jgi:hypothetical protein